MVDILTDHAGDFIPPGSKPKTDRQRWEWAVTIALGVLAMIGGAHIAQACGFLTWLGLGGFAMAADVSKQQATLTQIQITQITHDMRDAKTQVCRAQQQKNQAALNSWGNELQASRALYFTITKTWPDALSCEELLVTGNGG